jgi:hypothetical protein
VEIFVGELKKSNYDTGKNQKQNPKNPLLPKITPAVSPDIG